MAHRGHLSRATLGLRSPRSRSTNITPSRGGCTRHYGGSTLGISLDLSGHARCINVWRGWQNYHMDSHKWADIAYTAGYCQHGYTFAGRGFGVRTAANGTDKGNQSWYAFTFIGGGSDVPSSDALDALDWLVVQARNDGAGNSFNAHSDHKNTACPGNFLRNYTFGNRTGAQKSPSTTPALPPKPAPVVKPAPTRPAPKSDLVLAREVIDGKHGSGKDRIRSLGARYNAVQLLVNGILGGSGPQVKPAAKSIAALAREVIDGKHGSGDARRRSLGSRYNAVQAEVNRIVGGSAAPARKAKSIATLAQEVIDGKHGGGDARRRSLGAQYRAVQNEVNRRLR